MQDNYKEILQAVLEGKQLQFKSEFIEDDVWRDDYKNSGSNEDITKIMKGIHTFVTLLYRVKPEKKVFKYQTRAYLTTNHKVIIWTSTNYASQETASTLYGFSRWIGPIQEHEVVYE